MNIYDKDGNRQVPYKEDSTKGNSIVKPLNYKGDMLTQTWVDSRVLATLSKWLIDNGYYPRSLSDVARRPLEILVEFLSESGKVEMVQTTHEAREHLSNRYRVNLNRGGRGQKNVLHNQILSDKREELGEKVASGQKFVDVSVPTAKRNLPIDIDRAVELYKAIQEREGKASSMSAIESMKESGLIVSTDLHEGMTMDEVNERQGRIDAEVIARENGPLDLNELLKGVVR
jgi:hypothetical protein